jgi:glyoxylase-like metal-dependent hydrolase (beta-lactamase superfamily II)
MSIQIIPLSEGIFTIGHDKIFIPFDPQSDILTDRPTGSLLVEIQPFLVKAKGKNILFDTGLGYHLPNGDLQIHANLRQHGLEPADIHMVLMSHLHKDHAGGISYVNPLEIRELSFPNAQYYVSRQEFDFALTQGKKSYIPDDFELLKNCQQIEWLEAEGQIHNHIRYQTDGGHCPYHMSFLLHSESESIFFGGDVAPQLRQLKTRYVAKYDYDGKVAMEKRQEYARRGMAENWTFLFYHDVKTPYSRLPLTQN